MNTLSSNAQSFYDWMSTFPAISITRLKKINLAANSARHIILTISYSICDPNIGCLSRVITNFLLLRMKYERQGKTRACQKLEKKLNELHSAIDAITEVRRLEHVSHQVCKSSNR